MGRKQERGLGGVEISEVPKKPTLYHNAGRCILYQVTSPTCHLANTIGPLVNSDIFSQLSFHSFNFKELNPRLILLHALYAQQACRAATCSLHIWRSLAMNLMPSQVFPISFISFSTVRRHVILGRPRLRFPSGVQCIAVFAMEASWRVTWPIHLQRLLIRMVAIGSVPHRSKRSLLGMKLGLKMRKIRRRLLV